MLDRLNSRACLIVSFRDASANPDTLARPAAEINPSAIRTLEGLPALWAKERGTTGAVPQLHPVQQAWIDMQVPECGYCQNGMMIQAADLLTTVKHPTDDQIKQAMNGHLCRCGTYTGVIEAIKWAARLMNRGAWHERYRRHDYECVRSHAHAAEVRQG